MLEIIDLSIFYGKAEILHDINLRVELGELVFVIGPNGTGKTALLRTISGLLKPKKGYIKFLGERIDGVPPHKIVKKGISYC